MWQDQYIAVVLIALMKDIAVKWPKIRTALDQRCLNLIIAAFLFVMCLTIIFHPFYIHHDCAGILHTAEAILLDGKLPYVDIECVNPPLIYYLNTIPVMIAQFFSVNVISVFSLLVFSLIIWSTLTVRNLLSHPSRRFTQSQANVISLSLVICSFVIWRKHNFGQREHLFILMYLPFFVCRWVRWEGGIISSTKAITLGIIGAIGVCIKPHFVLISFVPELYWCLSKRSFRKIMQPEMLAFVMTGFAYALSLLFLPAEMKEAFFGVTLPFVLKGYHVYNTPIEALLLNDAVFVIPLLIITAIPFLIDNTVKSSSWSISRPLAILTIACFGGYLIQHKGWGYQAIPFFYGSIFLLTVIVLQLKLFVFRNDNNPGELFRGYLTKCQVCLIVLILFLCWGLKIVKAGVVPLPNNPITRLISQYSEEGDAIEFITTSQTPGYPTLLQMNRRRASRYGNHFPLPFIRVIKKEDPVLAMKEEKRYLSNLAEDISASRPRLIFVANGPYNQGMPEGFNYLQYLIDSGFVDGAMKNYALLQKVTGFAVFRLKTDNQK